jgi:hypothetical protein
VKRVAEYRNNAEACRELAAMMPEAQRHQLLDMAALWELIANEREDALKAADALPLGPMPVPDR